MYVDFEKFKDRKRDGSPRFTKCCRISDQTKEELKEFAAEKGLKLNEMLNCAIDYGCRKIETDEEFRDKILNIPTKRKSVRGEMKQKIILKEDTNEKLEDIKHRYRLFNENGFISDTIISFLEDIK